MVSVIVPMYNNESTIIKCLDSIINQTANNKILEVIVINDGSTDNSLEVVETYRKNKKISIKVINKSNGGASSARNIGLKEAKGEYIALLDSDDVWLPTKIERQMEILESNKNIDFLGCDSDKEGIKILGKKIDYLHKANIKELCIKCFPSTPSSIFKKEIVYKIGYFDETQKYGEDMNYFNKICVNFEYYHLSEYLVYIGDGKPCFGHSGLSANLKEMHKGNLKNIKELKDSKNISVRFYILMYIFYWIKHFRRIIITKLRNAKSSTNN